MEDSFINIIGRFFIDWENMSQLLYEIYVHDDDLPADWEYMTPPEGCTMENVYPYGYSPKQLAKMHKAMYEYIDDAEKMNKLFDKLLRRSDLLSPEIVSAMKDRMKSDVFRLKKIYNAAHDAEIEVKTEENI